MASMNSSDDICSPTSPPPAAISSSADNVSRAEPPPCVSTYAIASSLTFKLASLMTQRTCSSRSCNGNKWNCKCCVRERMVSLTFCGSVVANTNTTCGGGSSRVFRSAASAAFDNMCTSSKMNTRWRPGFPSDERSIRSRMFSTPLLLAASSSKTSYELPLSMEPHELQMPHGSPSSGDSQFNTLARMRAVEVLPVPRGPENR